MAILRKVAWFVIASCRSLVQIHPPPPFSDYFAQCICPKGARDFWPENAENRPRSGLIDHSEPVFSGFTVFWAISALKARKLPDLSGRQIRQLICEITQILIELNTPVWAKPRQTGVFIFTSKLLTQRSGVFKFPQGYSFALYNHRDTTTIYAFYSV